MKKLLKLSLALVLITAFSCSSDDTPAVIPTVSVMQDRNIVEPGDVVTFTSNAVDADSFSWDFGDGNTSTEANPTHDYNTTGSFTVTVTVTSSTGDTANSMTTVTVGTRVLVGLTINTMPDLDQFGVPWDSDGSGADLFLGFKPSNIADFDPIEVAPDLTSNNLPLSGNLPPASQLEFTNENWDFIFFDNDEPLDFIDANEIMGAIVTNPIAQQSNDKNYTTGLGSFTIVADAFSLTLNFELRVP